MKTFTFTESLAECDPRFPQEERLFSQWMPCPSINWSKWVWMVWALMDVLAVSLTRHPARRHVDLHFSAFLFHAWGSGTSSLYFFPPDVKCQPSVDISPNTQFSACNLHHLQCSWVWPLGAEAEHEHAGLKMADWRMALVWHSRVKKLNLCLLPVSENSSIWVPHLLKVHVVTKINTWESKKRDRNTNAWQDGSSAALQHRGQRGKTKRLWCLCLLSRSCWASISAVASCEALTLGASGLAPSWGERRRAVWWLRRQSARGGGRGPQTVFCLLFAILQSWKSVLAIALCSADLRVSAVFSRYSRYERQCGAHWQCSFCQMAFSQNRSVFHWL